MVDFLSSLPKIVERKKKRIGRGLGSGRGAKSGRGTTRHQKARENIPLHFEGGQAKVVKKYPLLRGKGKNKPIGSKPILIPLTALNIFKEGEEVDLKSMIDKNIIDKKAQKKGAKILAGGKLTKKLTVRLKVSSAAKHEIEQSGGQVII